MFSIELDSDGLPSPAKVTKLSPVKFYSDQEKKLVFQNIIRKVNLMAGEENLTKVNIISKRSKPKTSLKELGRQGLEVVQEEDQ